MTGSAPSGRSSSVLYALGRLQAQVEEARRENKELPEQIAALFNPRLVALERTTADHGKRLLVVERRWWLLLGAFGAVTTIVEGWNVIHG